MQKHSWQTFGHEPAKIILDKQVSSGKFPHAYLFCGPEGLGKKTLALEFAQKVLGTDKLSNHPDFAILDQAGEITMEPVLDFISKLGFKPFLAQKKIAVINNAQNLNLQSSNALLKTLEEPSASSIIILIANSSRLLPTIVSRCQVLNLSSFSKSRQAEFAKSNNLNFEKSVEELSFGRPARLKKLCEDKEFLQNEEEVVQTFKDLKKMRLADKLVSIGRLAEMEADDLKDNLLTWLMWQTGQLASSPEDYPKVSALGESLLGLKRNKNKKLVLQGLLLKI